MRSLPKPTTITLYGTAPDSIVDGPGLRYAVFVQGCSHHCPGCHNPESQPREGGTVTDIDDLVADIKANRLIHDVTISGGEPFEQVEAVAELARRLKFEGYGLWAYTGYLYEELLERAKNDPELVNLLEMLDVLVDGPFIESQKSLGLLWKGSANQRVIDLKATRDSGNVVLWESSEEVFEKPASW